MKKIFIIGFVFSSLIAATSCNEDTINVDPIGYTEAGFFESEQEFDWAVRGIYQKVGNYYAFQGDPANVVQALWMLPSDDLTTRGTAFTEEFFTGLNASNGRLSRFYTLSYQAIQRANTLIEKLDEKGARVFTLNPQNINIYRGEALFLRGYVNYMLWNVFGTAPIVTKRLININEASTAYTNSTGVQLLDQAIADLKAASDLLPNSWNAANLGRVTKNSAWGMRAKALVFRATVTGSNTDYLEAIAEVDKIGTGGAEARSLVTASVTRNNVTIPAYARNFEALDENNSESLFEFQANRSLEGANPFLNPDDFSTIGEMGFYVGYFNQLPNWVNERYYTGTTLIYNAYDAQDPRRAINFRPNPNLQGTAPNVDKYVRNYIGVFGVNGGPVGLATTNPRTLRLADILLIKAEAIAMSNGNLNDAIAIINTIRARARNSTTTGTPSVEPADRPLTATKAEVLQWIFEERRLELAFEDGHRWFDLRRRHLAASPDIKVDLKTWNFAGPTGTKFEDFNVNFPLPNNDVQQTALEQNTGY